MRMRNPEVQRLIKLIANRRGMNIDTVQQIVEAPFKFQGHIMRNYCDRETLQFPSVRIEHFGIFYCPDYIKERCRKINEKTNGNNRHKRVKE